MSGLAVEAEQVLAFRLDRMGLSKRAAGLASVASCPASDVSKDAALLALSARVEGLTRDVYDAATDAGDLVVAHALRGAIHLLAPNDLARYGRALVARDDAELGTQLGEQVTRLTGEAGISPNEALDQVADATTKALARGRALDKLALHDELRERVGSELLPWCRGCKSHHVAPMLWRYATIKAGVRLDSERRYRMGTPGRTPAADDAVRGFLRFYGPATAGDFGGWAGLATSHAQRLWSQVEDDLAEVKVGRRTAWLGRNDLRALTSPPESAGIRLLPPGDPYLQAANRPLLTPDATIRKRLFQPVASPGAVLQDGRLSGLWRVRVGRRSAEVTVEPLRRLRRRDLEDEARRIAELQGVADVRVIVG